MKRLSWPWVISWRLYGIYDPGGLCLIPVLLNFTEHLSLFSLLYKTMSTEGNVMHRCSIPDTYTNAKASAINDMRFMLDPFCGYVLISVEFKWEFGTLLVCRITKINLTHAKYRAAKSRIKNVFRMDDFALDPPQFYPPPPRHAVLFQVRMWKEPSC